MGNMIYTIFMVKKSNSCHLFCIYCIYYSERWKSRWSGWTPVVNKILESHVEVAQNWSSEPPSQNSGWPPVFFFLLKFYGIFKYHVEDWVNQSFFHDVVYDAMNIIWGCYEWHHYDVSSVPLRRNVVSQYT